MITPLPSFPRPGKAAYLTGLALLLAQALQALNTPVEIPIWDDAVPGLHADAGPERIEKGRIVGVHFPTLTVYRPDGVAPADTAVISCPGGGYHHLTIGENGGPVTEWLNSLGVTVFILKYRLGDYGHPAPLQDVVQAIRLVRSRAEEFGVSPGKIGVFGASAGGHLAGCAAEFWDSEMASGGGDVAGVSARPDFAILVYPVVTMEAPYVNKGSLENLLGNEATPERQRELSLEHHVRPDMPPLFVVATMADKSVPVQNSLLLYQALSAAHVPAELHIYAQGSHGNSLDPQYGPTALWRERATEWLRHNCWIPAAD